MLGVELASEIIVKHGIGKKVGLCLRGEQLLPGLPPKAGRLATEFLESQGVVIHYKTTYGETTAKELGYSLGIAATGFTFRSDFLKENLEQCLSPNG